MFPSDDGLLLAIGVGLIVRLCEQTLFSMVSPNQAAQGLHFFLVTSLGFDAQTLSLPRLPSERHGVKSIANGTGHFADFFEWKLLKWERGQLPLDHQFGGSS